MNSSPLLFISDDAFREIFQSMAEGIVMVDENGVIVASNPVIEQIFGYAKHELDGMPLENLLPERFRGRHKNLRLGYNAHPEPKRMGIGRDLVALRKDGKEFPVEISLSYTRVINRLVIIAFVSDISLRKKSEDALKESEEQLAVYAGELEKKVSARTDDLNKTIRELEKEINERKRAEAEARNALEKERELNDLKSKFVSIASHEFRTPLSTILSSISLVDQYRQRNEFDKMGKHTQRVRNSVDHLTSILNDFLSLGKLEEGKIDVVDEPIQLNSLLQDIQEELDQTLKPGQAIIVELENSEETIISDSRIIRNILFNLLSNASKYSNNDKKINVFVRREKASLVMRIKDEGIGIPQEDQKHLFDRFFRASNASSIQGTGLGLHIVKRYVELLKGTISFESEVMGGSTFIVSIPLKINI
jgi:PAS domain S-box-containing protein